MPKLHEPWNGLTIYEDVLCKALVMLNTCSYVSVDPGVEVAARLGFV